MTWKMTRASSISNAVESLREKGLTDSEIAAASDRRTLADY